MKIEYRWLKSGVKYLDLWVQVGDAIQRYRAQRWSNSCTQKSMLRVCSVPRLLFTPLYFVNVLVASACLDPFLAIEVRPEVEETENRRPYITEDGTSPNVDDLDIRLALGDSCLGEVTLSLNELEDLDGESRFNSLWLLHLYDGIEVRTRVLSSAPFENSNALLYLERASGASLPSYTLRAESVLAAMWADRSVFVNEGLRQRIELVVSDRPFREVTFNSYQEAEGAGVAKARWHFTLEDQCP